MKTIALIIGIIIFPVITITGVEASKDRDMELINGIMTNYLQNRERSKVNGNIPTKKPNSKMKNKGDQKKVANFVDQYYGRY